MSEYEKLIEKILSHFAGEDFKGELVRAKKEFFESSVTLDENSGAYDLRMSQFYDWYFFSRELSGFRQTPLSACLLVRELRFSELELKQLEALKNHRHSLFEFIKTKGSDVYIKDLLANKKLVVKSSPWIFGFDEEELFEARLLPHEDTYVFTRGFCFHPGLAKKFILDEVKRHQKDPDLDPGVMMLRLMKMRFKYEQYKHVNPEMIYTNDGMLGL